jgi:hypothetical protein
MVSGARRKHFSYIIVFGEVQIYAILQMSMRKKIIFLQSRIINSKVYRVRYINKLKITFFVFSKLNMAHSRLPLTKLAIFP